MRCSVAILAVIASGLMACEGTTEARVTYTAALAGANERPNAVTTNGSGTWSATLDANNVLTYTLVVTGLNGNVTMAHVHGPAPTTANAGVLVDFSLGGRTLVTGATSGTSSGTIDLTLSATPTVSGDSLRKLLDNGNAYVNVHTSTNGAGEIRGQIVRQ